MIKNIVFDIGNVLLKFDRDEVVKKVYDGKNFSALKHAIFYGWEEQDEGIITPENHLKRAKSSI